MKKLFLITVIIASFLSCQKEDITKGDNSSILQYNESNTQGTTWEELSDELLNAPYATASNLKSSYYSYKVGPWGGTNGNPFSYQPEPNTTIYAIAMEVYLGRITRLVVWYKDSQNTIEVGIDAGSHIAGATYYTQYFTDDEYIKSVSGRAGTMLARLEIVTNKKLFAYGNTSSGSPFTIGTLPSDEQVLGFFGSSGAIISNIGFYIYTR